MILILLFLFSTARATALEWSEVLNEIQDQGKAGGACSAEENADLCANPVKVVCDPKNWSPSVETVGKTLRSSIAKTSGADAFDLQMAKVSDAEKKVDVLVHDLELFVKITPVIGRALDLLTDRLFEAEVDLVRQRQKQLDLISTLEDKVLAHYKKTQADLMPILKSVIDSEVSRVDSDPAFEQKSGPLLIQPGQADLVQQLKLTEIKQARNLVAVDLDGLASIQDSDMRRQLLSILNGVASTQKAFLEKCGADGMINNAENSVDPGGRANSVILCPGMLLNILENSGGKLDSIVEVLGHEVGHSIGPGRSVQITDENELWKKYPRAKKDATPSNCYSSLIQCLDQYFVKDKKENFSSLSAVLEHLQSVGIPKMKEELKKAQEATPLNPVKVARILYFLNSGELAVKKDISLEASAKKEGIDPANPLSFIEDELVADYFSAPVISDALKKTAKENRRGKFIQANLGFCYHDTPLDAEIVQIKWGSMFSDPLHPPNDFRIENLMRNPEIRKSLGCAPLKKTDRPWCDLKGAASR